MTRDQIKIGHIYRLDGHIKKLKKVMGFNARDKTHTLIMVANLRENGQVSSQYESWSIRVFAERAIEEVTKK